MRLVWVSFDVMGRDCLAAAAEAGADVVGVVTLPGPVDPNRSGQCSFDEIAGRLGARLIETADVNSPETTAAVREVEPDLIFIVGWSQLVLDEFIGLGKHGVFGMHPTLLPKHRGRAAIPWAKRTPADGIIDWETRAPYLYDWVRAQTRPYPGAFTFLGDEKVVVWRARPVELDEDAPAGTVVAHEGEGVVVACGEGGLVL